MNIKTSYDLPEDCQEKYDLVMQYINNLPLDNDDKQSLIDRIDDLIDWIRTSDNGGLVWENSALGQFRYTCL